MIWISSFPRSGNTFLRNILFEVYGLESSSFYENKGQPENYRDFPFVKTHHMPEDLPQNELDGGLVYLVRDGRDALVSMAFQQIQIYKSERPFREIFIEATLAAEGSYFGGWSKNVEAWLERADLVIRFEDLIEAPLEQAERFRSLRELPPQDPSKLPTFQGLKFGSPKYGRGKRHAANEEEELEIVKKSFRKGKAFGWVDELDRELQNLFWTYHRVTMERMGYLRQGGLRPFNSDFDYAVMKKLGLPTQTQRPQYKILIEANKLLMHRNDGVKRYQLELLKALYPVVQNPDCRWEIDIYLKGKIYPLREFGGTLFDVRKNENNNASIPLAKKRLAYYIRSSISFVKSLVPIPIKDYIKNNYRKLLIKMGLKFADQSSRLRHMLKLKGKQNLDAAQGTERFKDYDLVFVPLPQHYEPFVKVEANYVVTTHDLTHKLFSEFHTKSNTTKAEAGYNFFLEKNADFICISESTRQDMLAHYPVTEEKLHTVLEAADSKKFIPDYFNRTGFNTRKVYDIPPEPFLFTLSTLEPRKNLENTIKAFDLLLDENPDLKCNLVIGGKKGWDAKEIMRLRHKNNIVFTGFINENDLPDLYREATAVCYVSYYEGFGLPPLEAMSCKTPVIYGNNSSMKELFEGYGLGADPNDIVQIKEHMKLLMTDAKARQEWAEKGLERSFDFSWRKAAEETLNVFESVIQKNRNIAS